MKKILIFIIVALTSLCANAFSIESVRFHCADDTVKINGLLKDAIADRQLKTPGQFMSFFADRLIDTPYVAHTLEGDKEYLTINIDQLDCTTFVETLVALTRAAMMRQATWLSYASALENLRYHNGEINGYASRLHYISAWIIENSSRGNFVEISSMMPHCENLINTLNYMSAHRDCYPALADSLNYAGIKNLEAGYNRHMYPYINKKNIHKKEFVAELKNGDIICITTKIEGLDVSHLGIVRLIDGKPHLLHASSAGKKVLIDKYDLSEMLRNNRTATGVRVLRVQTAY